MEQIHVKLPWHVVRYACMVGIERMLAGQGKPGRYGAIQEDGWRLNVIGACGEAAVAQHFNYYWDGNLGDFAAKDVNHFQVRANGRENGDLIVRGPDKDEDKYILVSGDISIPGFILNLLRLFYTSEVSIGFDDFVLNFNPFL